MSDETPVWDPDGILPDHLHRSFAVLVEGDYGRPRADFRVMAYTPILWTGWECDYGMVLIDIDGERKTAVLAGVAHPGDSGPAEMLRERLQAYRQAIADTERFLAALEDDGNAGVRVGSRDFLRDRGYADPDETRQRFALANAIALQIEKRGLTTEGAAGIAGISVSDMLEVVRSGATYTTEALSEILRKLGGSQAESENG